MPCGGGTCRTSECANVGVGATWREGEGGRVAPALDGELDCRARGEAFAHVGDECRDGLVVHRQHDRARHPIKDSLRRRVQHGLRLRPRVVRRAARRRSRRLRRDRARAADRARRLGGRGPLGGAGDLRDVCARAHA
eukprot:7196587-Prymnesium_polylepis.1